MELNIDYDYKNLAGSYNDVNGCYPSPAHLVYPSRV